MIHLPAHLAKPRGTPHTHLVFSSAISPVGAPLSADWRQFNCMMQMAGHQKLANKLHAKLITAWSPSEGAISRKSEAFGYATMLVFDLDRIHTMDIDEVISWCPGKDVLVHTTFSHGVDGYGCFRIYMLLDETVNADQYRTLHAALLATLPELAKRVDPSCADPVRCYFMPSCPTERHHLAETRPSFGGNGIEVGKFLAPASGAAIPQSCLPAPATTMPALTPPAAATKGQRNQSLVSWAGRVYAHGYTPEGFMSVAQRWGKLCNPPMDPSEVTATVSSMWKTHQRNHADDPERAARRETQRRENAEIGGGEQFDPLPEVLTCNDMLDRFIFLADGSRVFDTKHPKHVLPLSDFRNATAASVSNGNTGVFTTDGKPKAKRIANSQSWLDSPQRLSAMGTTFNASAGLYALDPSGRRCVNVWTGFDRRVDPGDADISLVLAQIRWLFKDRADDFLDWLAHIEQQPGVLPHTAWLHISSFTGTGRNAIARLLSRVFPGYAAMSLALERLLDSGFNDELSAKVLAVVDEIRVGGRDQWRHTETLKQMISAQVRHINVKYGRKSVEVNACRFLVFSNHRNAIPIDDTDRRVEVVICDDAPKAEAYYTELYRDVDDKHVVAAFAKFLRHRDISAFNPGRHAVKSADKEQVVAVTGSEEYAALREFTKTYAPPLVTYDRLAKAAGVSAFSGDARRFAHAVLEAGWQRVGRTSTKGQRVVIYAKSAFAAQWISKKEAFAEGLPVCDGGNVDWTEGE